MNRAYFAVTEHLLRDWPEDIGRLRERSGLARSWEELEGALSAWAEARAVELARREAAALTAVGEENPWEQVLRRAHVNLGMAVAVEAGLIVPVIRDADKMGLEELSKTARDYAVRAREGRLAAEEYRDSTFTVSNLGMFGVESFTPIINQPDAAILGINSMEEELCRQADGSIGSRMVMRISLTYDHRLIDGAGAADFENCVRKLLESPLDILL